MMNKRILAIVLLVVLVLAMAGCGNKKAQEASEAAVDNTVVAAPEATVSVLEDSIFDDEPDEPKETEKPEEPKPTQPVPTQPVPTQTIPDEPDSTDPIPQEPDPLEPAPPKPSQPVPTQPVPATPQPTQPVPTQPVPPVNDLAAEYEWFMSLSPSEQQAFMESFASIDAFFEWLNMAKEAYEKANPPIEVGSGSIDIGAIIAGKK